MSRTFIFLLTTMLASLWAQERTVDPTWLHRYLPELNQAQADLSSATCHYKPVFAGDEKQHQIFRSVSRFGEVTIDPSGSCQSVFYDRQEEIYFVLEGTGTLEFG